jgi:hypothetical protein
MKRPGSWPVMLAPTARAVAVLAVALAIGSLLLSWPAPAQANDTSVGGVGGDIFPLSNTDIRLEAETVQAICYRHFAEYRVDFQFVNDGEPQTLMLGFPYLLVGPEGNGTVPVAFRAWQDGQPLQVSMGKGHDGDTDQGYYLHKATFPRGQTMIRVSYLGNPTYTAATRFPELVPTAMNVEGLQGQAARYDYWLHTGAGWAGPIGEAVVVYRLADDFKGWALDIKSSYQEVSEDWPWTTSPETYSNPDDRTFVWEFGDLEPTDDDDVLLAFTAPFPEVDFSNEGSTDGIPPVFGAVVFTDSSWQDQSASDYMADWAIVDGSPASAWSTGNPGTGGWVKVKIEGNQSIEEFRILPGRSDTLTSFADFGRPKTVRVTLSDGTSKTFDLADDPTVQTFPIQGNAEWARVEVLEVYRGAESGETYISEISFGNRPAPRFRTFAELIGEASGPTDSSTATSAAPPTTGSSAVTDSTQAADDSEVQEDDEWRLWAIVAFAVAGAALVALIVLLVLFFSRRRVPPGEG